MLNTCKKIDNPPKPSKKDVKIIFIEIALIGILDINEIPFVISIKPVINGATNVDGIFNNFKKGEKVKVNTFNNLLDLKIEIVTEDRTTNPPIIVIVETALDIAFESTSPKLEERNVFFKKIFLENFVEELFF